LQLQLIFSPEGSNGKRKTGNDFYHTQDLVGW
jgi:hypothetical protein